MASVPPRLQVAFEIRRHGRLDDVAVEGTGDENRRLKKIYAEAQMSADILKEALAKKW